MIECKPCITKLWRTTDDIKDNGGLLAAAKTEHIGRHAYHE